MVLSWPVVDVVNVTGNWQKDGCSGEIGKAPVTQWCKWRAKKTVVTLKFDHQLPSSASQHKASY